MKETYKVFITIVKKMNQKLFKEKSHGNPLFLRGFVFVCCLFACFTVKSTTVQPGQILWRISRSGIDSSYLIGINHEICLNEDSLPPKLKMVLEKSTIGLIELISSENTSQNIMNTAKSRFKLPKGQTLLSYMSDEDALKIFKFIQSYITGYDTKGILVRVLRKQVIGADITAYKDFIHLHPIMIQGIVLIFKIYSSLDEEFKQIMVARLADSVKQSKVMERNCLFNKGQLMDSYLEQKVSCTGKPVHSIETAESQLSDMFSAVDHHFEAEKLKFMVDKFILNGPGQTDAFNEMDIQFRDWNSFTLAEKNSLRSEFMYSYYLGIEMEKTDIKKNISDFLKDRHCSIPPESFLRKYEDQVISFTERYIQYIFNGKTMDEKTEQIFRRLIKEIGLLERKIISSCFPDYMWPDNVKEMTKRQEQLSLTRIKQEMERLFISRDKKLALFITPFLEKGGVIAGVGFGHFIGIIRDLRARGWNVKPIELSRSLKPANCNLSDESDLDLQSILELPTHDDSGLEGVIVDW